MQSGKMGNAFPMFAVGTRACISERLLSPAVTNNSALGIQQQRNTTKSIFYADLHRFSMYTRCEALQIQ
jgi:hypothetical protein